MFAELEDTLNIEESRRFIDRSVHASNTRLQPKEEVRQQIGEEEVTEM